MSQAEIPIGQAAATSVLKASVTAPGMTPLSKANRGQPTHSGQVASAEIAALAPIVREVLRSPGQPLDPTTRAFMESRFRRSLGDVRLHTDAKAAASARSVNARAFTFGQNIVFGGNQYAPETHAGRKLLAHELAHTIQQRGGAIETPPLPDSNGIFESSAKAAARDVAMGRACSQDLPTCGLALSRQPVGEEDRPKPVAVFPTTLSLIHADPRQITDEEIYGEIEARKREEEKATKERKERELKESHDRLLLLRGKLDTCGYMYSKNQVMAMITKDSLLDLQLLRRHGLELPGFFTKRKTFYHNVIASIDKFDYEWRKTHGTAGPVANPTNVEALEAAQRQREAEAARWEGLPHVEGSLAGAVAAEATSWFTSDPRKITAGAKMGTAATGTVGSAAAAKATQIQQAAIRESAKTTPPPPAAVGTKTKSEPTPTPAQTVVPEPSAKSSQPAKNQPAKATTQREMEEAATQKAITGGKGQKRSKGKATTQREMQEAAAQKRITVAAKGEFTRLPGREPDIGVMEIRADGSVSIVVANREDVRALTGANTHIALANAPEGLGPITEGARRYRFYLDNKSVTHLEPLGKAAQTPELVGVIGRALQRHGLASPKGTSINLSPGKPDEALKGTVFSR